MFLVTGTACVGEDLPSMDTWLSGASYLEESQGSSTREPEGEKPLSEVSSIFLELMASGSFSSAATSRLLFFCVFFLLVLGFLSLGISPNFFSVFDSFDFPGGE